MSEDQRVEPPPQPSTKQMPREDILQAQLSQLLARTTDGFAKVDSLVTDVRNLGANLEIVSSDLGVVKDRVAILETERTKYSGGIRGLSASDGNQSMQIASLAVKVDDLAAKADAHTVSQSAQTVMLTKLTGILDTPMARRLGYAVAGLLLAALTTATGYFARGNVQQQQPTIIQVAPATQVPHAP